MVDDRPLDAISITDLARRRGVSKQAISKRVKALAAEGRLSLWPGPNRSVMVSEAAYDFAIGATGDPAKEAAAASVAALRGAECAERSEFTPPAGEAVDTTVRLAEAVEGETPGYRDAKARDAYYSAELKRLAFERENRRTYYVEEVEAALVRISGAVRNATKSLITRAEEGAEALDRGMPAFRRWLADVGDDICRQLAAEWRVMADEVANEAETPSEED